MDNVPNPTQPNSPANVIANVFVGFCGWVSDTLSTGANTRRIAETGEQTKQILEQHKATSDKIADQLVILNSYMARMEQSSLRTEQTSVRMEKLSFVMAYLTVIITALTMLSVVWYAYSFLKDLGVTPIMSAVYIILFGLLTVIALILKQHLSGAKKT